MTGYVRTSRCTLPFADIRRIPELGARSKVGLPGVTLPDLYCIPVPVRGFGLSATETALGTGGTRVADRLESDLAVGLARRDGVGTGGTSFLGATDLLRESLPEEVLFELLTVIWGNGVPCACGRLDTWGSRRGRGTGVLAGIEGTGVLHGVWDPTEAAREEAPSALVS